MSSGEWGGVAERITTRAPSLREAISSGLVFDPEAFYQALDVHRRSLVRERGTRVSWRMVAEEVGVVPSTFSRLGIRHSSLTANVLIKLLAWMGQTDLAPYIREIPKDSAPTKRSDPNP